MGLYRIGSEEYADHNGGLGLATIRKEHVAFKDGKVVFDYPAKSGVRLVQTIDDPSCAVLIRTLRRRRRGAPELLAYRAGRHWASIRSDDINEYLKQQMAEDVSAKDLRTWNATVLAAVALAATGGDTHTKTARRRVTDRAVRGVSEILGNTPAVARRSYRPAALRPLPLGLDDRPRPAAPRRPRSARRTNANRTGARRTGSARRSQRLAGCRAHRRLAVLPAGRSRRMNMFASLGGRPRRRSALGALEAELSFGVWVSTGVLAKMYPPLT